MGENSEVVDGVRRREKKDDEWGRDKKSEAGDGTRQKVGGLPWLGVVIKSDLDDGLAGSMEFVETDTPAGGDLLLVSMGTPLNLDSIPKNLVRIRVYMQTFLRLNKLRNSLLFGICTETSERNRG